MTDESWFDSCQEKLFYLQSQTLRRAQGPTQFVTWEYSRVKRRGPGADYLPHLVTRLRVSGAIPSLHHMRSWRAQGHVCIYLAFSWS